MVEPGFDPCDVALLFLQDDVMDATPAYEGPLLSRQDVRDMPGIQDSATLTSRIRKLLHDENRPLKASEIGELLGADAKMQRQVANHLTAMKKNQIIAHNSLAETWALRSDRDDDT